MTFLQHDSLVFMEWIGYERAKVDSIGRLKFYAQNWHSIISFSKEVTRLARFRRRSYGSILDARNGMHLQGMEEFLIAIFTIFYQSSI